MPYKGKEEANAYHREYKKRRRLEDPVKARAADLKYDMTRREKKREYNSEYYEAHHEIEKKRSNEWAKQNPEKAFARGLHYKYKLPVEEYDRLVASQNGQCAICAAVTKLCVDHCHETGKVRGLLCLTCNTGIGHLKDSIEIIRQALYYLEKGQQNED